MGPSRGRENLVREARQGELLELRARHPADLGIPKGSRFTAAGVDSVKVESKATMCEDVPDLTEERAGLHRHAEALTPGGGEHRRGRALVDPVCAGNLPQPLQKPSLGSASQQHTSVGVHQEAGDGPNDLGLTTRALSRIRLGFTPRVGRAVRGERTVVTARLTRETDQRAQLHEPLVVTAGIFGIHERVRL